MLNIESKFYGDMNWSNHASFWVLDHIIPIKAFDLTREDHREYSNSLVNLQPLTIEDHKKKTVEDVRNIKSYRKLGVIPEDWLGIPP